MFLLLNVYPPRPGSSSVKTIDYRLDSPGSIPGVGGGGDFSSLLRVQTGPGVHSASYKMSTGGLSPGVKAAERRTSHPTSFKCRGCEYVDPCIHIPRGPSWPVTGIPLPLRLSSLASVPVSPDLTTLVNLHRLHIVS